MIQEFVNRFIAAEQKIKERIANDPPLSYSTLVEIVIETVTDGDYGSLDPTRIHTIDDGDYQGTLLFIIADNSYQPSDYWAVKIGYGSCSGCDTLQAISETTYRYDDEPYVMPEQTVTDYWTLCLHIVQGLKAI